MGADQHFEPAITKLGSDLMSDAASFFKMGLHLEARSWEKGRSVEFGKSLRTA